MSEINKWKLSHHAPHKIKEGGQMGMFEQEIVCNDGYGPCARACGITADQAINRANLIIGAINGEQ